MKMKRPGKLSPERRRLLEQELQDGVKSLSALAREYSVSRTVVTRIKKRLPPKQKNAMKSYLELKKELDMAAAKSMVRRCLESVEHHLDRLDRDESTATTSLEVLAKVIAATKDVYNILSFAPMTDSSAGITEYDVQLIQDFTMELITLKPELVGKFEHILKGGTKDELEKKDAADGGAATVQENGA